MDGSQECPGSVNARGRRHVACLCLSAKSPHAKADQTETTGRHVLLSPITDTVSPKSDSTKHSPQGKVLPGFLPLELHTHPRAALEEGAFKLQPHLSMLVGSQKGKPFLLDFRLPKGTSGAKSRSPWTPRTTLCFNNL